MPLCDSNSILIRSNLPSNAQLNCERVIRQSVSGWITRFRMLERKAAPTFSQCYTVQQTAEFTALNRVTSPNETP
jgi:hypothetical protein